MAEGSLESPRVEVKNTKSETGRLCRGREGPTTEFGYMEDMKFSGAYVVGSEQSMCYVTCSERRLRYVDVECPWNFSKSSVSPFDENRQGIDSDIDQIAMLQGSLDRKA